MMKTEEKSKKARKHFTVLLSALSALAFASCTLGAPTSGNSGQGNSESSFASDTYKDIELTESLFFDCGVGEGEVPIYESTVGEFEGVMVGYAGSDGRYNIYGKYAEDFEVEIDETFYSGMRLGYVFAPSQWCVTEFIVCDNDGNKLFGIVRDWLALSQLEFYNVGYIIDYRQSPNVYYAQGNQYSDIWETLNAKHLCSPKYNDTSRTGWFSVEVVENYLRVSTSVDDTAQKPLEQLFKYDASKGYKIKICDGRQRTLDYIEESKAPTTREYRTCVLITSLKKEN